MTHQPCTLSPALARERIHPGKRCPCTCTLSITCPSPPCSPACTHVSPCNCTPKRAVLLARQGYMHCLKGSVCIFPCNCSCTSRRPCQGVHCVLQLQSRLHTCNKPSQTHRIMHQRLAVKRRYHALTAQASCTGLGKVFPDPRPYILHVLKYIASLQGALLPLPRWILKISRVCWHASKHPRY